MLSCRDCQPHDHSTISFHTSVVGKRAVRLVTSSVGKNSTSQTFGSKGRLPSEVYGVFAVTSNAGSDAKKTRPDFSN